MPKRICSFKPVYDERTEILVLGSIPGEASLKKNEYYGHKNNHFWKVISSALSAPLAADYTEKIDLLKRNKIGLWDTIEACEREGSRDDRISRVRPNNISKILKKCKRLKCVFLNGRKAESIFNRYNRASGVRSEYLPSMSPLNTMPVEEKTRIWRDAFNRSGYNMDLAFNKTRTKGR